MSLRSILRLRQFILRRDNGQLVPGALLALRLRTINANVHLRQAGSDLDTFDEIFVEQVYRSVFDYVPQCRTIVDLGANIGLATVYLSAHYEKARIVCVEPHPDTFRVLTMNTEALAEAGRCLRVNAAVWSHSTKLQAAAAALAAPTAYSRFETKEASGSGTIEGLSMEQILDLAKVDRIDLLKIDIEGSERMLFQGNLDWLHRVQAIAIEFHGASREETQFDLVATKNGFRIVSDTRHTVVVVRDSVLPQQQAH